MKARARQEKREGDHVNELLRSDRPILRKANAEGEQKHEEHSRDERAAEKQARHEQNAENDFDDRNGISSRGYYRQR